MPWLSTPFRIPIERVKPPPQLARINWNHPLARGLIGCWLMNEGGGVKALNLANGQWLDQATAGYVPGWKVNSRGIARDFDGADSRLDASAATFASNLSALTITAGISPDTVGEGGTGDGFILCKGAEDYGWSFGTTTNQCLRFACQFSTTMMDVYSVTSAFALATYANVSASWDGSVTASQVGLYIDGKALTHSIDTNGSGTHNDSSYVVYVGTSIFRSRTFDGTINYIYLHNRVLNPAEVIMLHDNPYIILQEDRRRVYFISSGAGTGLFDVFHGILQGTVAR